MIMQKILLTTAVFTALIGICYGRTDIASCPTSMVEFAVWLSSANSNCNEGLILALRESKDDCQDKVTDLGTCLSTARDKCLAGLDDGDMIGTMITQSLDPVIEATAFYSIIFCSSGVTTDWTPTTTVSSCDDRMDAASQECHAPFMAIFNEDRVDDRLCDAYKTMVSCETGKVRELCPDASDMEVGLDEQSRAMANYFCVEDDSVKSTVKSITTTVTSEVIATTSDDGVGAASVAKLSSITCGLLFLMAFYFLL